MKLFLFIFILILFAPLPIKFTLFFSKDNYFIKLYNFSLLKKEEKKDVNITKGNDKEKGNDAKKEKKTPNFFTNFDSKQIIRIVKQFKNNKYKPSLKINGYFNYSLTDAAKTAIFYGILSTYLPLLSWLLSIIFKIKLFKIPINPIYKDEIIAEIKITSIITLSLAQIIYMAILFIRVILFIKEDELQGGKI